MEWTIGELVEQASAVLAPAGQLNGRVRDVPNERLVRWYATIGLLDPPMARRGRIALYGRRHLLQLVAVKRRQADGRSIAEIQTELTGATDRTLEAIARLPGGPGGTGPEGGASGTAVPATARPRFWAAPPPAGASGAPRPGTSPTPAAPGRPQAPALPPQPAPPPPAVPPPAVPLPAVPLPAVRLAPGVTLLLDGAGRTPSEADLAAIAAASRALVAVLRERELALPEGNNQ
ncbi:MerR family transcriptional regulator [Planomonospora venezuelensis]|uniref:DNA-binding transcriptional MerR regulator n=1 Tax=Planomonospora venezuelensis TaxID=1999 RepID=A0A841CTQ2_PLAVE|nr:MerR family transcriptional regulator [Planomonospora venezuelensis]MBB5961792.1 DNA-binding transcriptional MerR regulator [Planomonospora venezuelensis]GIM99528.1 hypothetical protein Pve01_11870 [Planomonospora venezuelensis]